MKSKYNEANKKIIRLSKLFKELSKSKNIEKSMNLLYRVGLELDIEIRTMNLKGNAASDYIRLRIRRGYKTWKINKI